MKNKLIKAFDQEINTTLDSHLCVIFKILPANLFNQKIDAAITDLKNEISRVARDFIKQELGNKDE